MICSTETILSWCRREKRIRSGSPRHLAVAFHDLTDHGAGLQTGQTAEVNGRLGLAGADERAAVARAQREHVPGRDEIIGCCVRVHQHLHGSGPIRGGDSGRHARARLDRDGERRPQRGGVGALIDHQPQAEPVEALAVHRHADQPAAVGSHEIDRLRGRELRRDRQIALVLAILVVGDDQRFAVGERLDRFLDGTERRRAAAISSAPRAARLLCRLRCAGSLRRLVRLGHWAPLSCGPRVASRSSRSWSIFISNSSST